MSNQAFRDNLTTWNDRRLRETQIYLEHCVKDGSNSVYDKEDTRLRLDDVNREIARRKEQQS